MQFKNKKECTRGLERQVSKASQNYLRACQGRFKSRFPQQLSETETELPRVKGSKQRVEGPKGSLSLVDSERGNGDRH